jgi:hypothetical protein
MKILVERALLRTLNECLGGRRSATPVDAAMIASVSPIEAIRKGEASVVG